MISFGKNLQNIFSGLPRCSDDEVGTKSGLVHHIRDVEAARPDEAYIL